MNGQAERNNGEPEPAATDEGQVDEAAAQPGAGADDAAADDANVEALKAQVDENWDKYLRTAAELENVRKRAARDVDNARRFALERFATDLLAVCDSLEMGLASGADADAKALLEGSQATLKLLATTMERFGISEVDPAGEPFDPEFHEAMTMQPTDDVEPGSVVTVFQKGYTLNGRLLRPARVVVAQAPATPDEPAGEG